MFARRAWLDLFKHQPLGRPRKHLGNVIYGISKAAHRIKLDRRPLAHELRFRIARSNRPFVCRSIPGWCAHGRAVMGRRPVARPIQPAKAPEFAGHVIHPPPPRTRSATHGSQAEQALVSRRTGARNTVVADHRRAARPTPPYARDYLTASSMRQPPVCAVRKIALELAVGEVTLERP